MVVVGVACLAASKGPGVVVGGESARYLAETPAAAVRAARPPRKMLKCMSVLVTMEERGTARGRCGKRKKGGKNLWLDFGRGFVLRAVKRRAFD
jgi:hypothetical protein